MKQRAMGGLCLGRRVFKGRLIKSIVECERRPPPFQNWVAMASSGTFPELARWWRKQRRYGCTHWPRNRDGGTAGWGTTQKPPSTNPRTLLLSVTRYALLGLLSFVMGTSGMCHACRELCHVYTHTQRTRCNVSEMGCFFVRYQSPLPRQLLSA